MIAAALAEAHGYEQVGLGYAHYVKRSATVEGTPLEAFCGHVFVPTRDETKLPVCPECQAIYDGNDLEVGSPAGPDHRAQRMSRGGRTTRS